MKVLFPIAVIGLLAASLHAQEILPIEKAQQAAKLVTASPGATSNTPLKFEGDLEKPQVLKAEGVGFLVIPAKTLTEDALARAGKDVVPIGAMWSLKVVPQNDGKAVDSDRLRHVSVQTKDNTLNLACYQIGVQKNDKDGLDLVLFSKDQAPILKASLDRKTASQEYPIELAGRKAGENTGILTLNILGKYTAEITVSPEE